MKIIAFVVQASQVRQFLVNVGLPTESPKVHPMRGPPQSDLWDGVTVSEWEIDATYPEKADQDQSLLW
jgi:hypothetical protein